MIHSISRMRGKKKKKEILKNLIFIFLLDWIKNKKKNMKERKNRWKNLDYSLKVFSLF